MGQRIQFGCGLCAPLSWRNFDAGPAFWLQKHLPFTKSYLVDHGYPNYPPNIEYGNVISGLPVVAGSADAAYCSHVLEHLALDEFRATLRNVHTYLRPGGTFRMVLPDLAWLVREYSNSSDPYAASRFMRESYLGLESQDDGPRKLMRSFFGRSAHLWMWDDKNLAAELAAAGFINIRRAQFGDEPGFEEVESIHRWENCLGMNCTKP
jgi:SAM-dependent methyltransferase